VVIEICIKYPGVELARGGLSFGVGGPDFWRRAFFWVRLMGFGPEGPASGVEKRISGFFRASGNQKPETHFSTPEKSSPVREIALPTAHFFYVQNAP
jgi:hypothetical protein